MGSRSICLHIAEMRVLVFAVLIAGIAASQDRDGKLFLVTSTTSTSISTTTSILSTTWACFAVSGSTITAACKKRKKRMVLVDPIVEDDKEPIEISRVARGIDESIPSSRLESGLKSSEGQREAKFFWYYMTTTSTSTSTSSSIYLFINFFSSFPSSSVIIF